MEVWKCLFSNEIVQHLVQCTNIYITKNKTHFSREGDSHETTVEEIKALIGILYICGAMKSSHVNTKDIWATDGTGIDIVSCTMSRNRFHFLLRSLRLDDVRNRANRTNIDKITHVREVFELFVSNCQKAYTIGEYATLDENLVAFRGRCSFRQYMPNKPAKYGLKVFMLVDARTIQTT